MRDNFGRKLENLPELPCILAALRFDSNVSHD